jgi:hypothetical protein
MPTLEHYLRKSILALLFAVISELFSLLHKVTGGVYTAAGHLIHPTWNNFVKMDSRVEEERDKYG